MINEVFLKNSFFKYSINEQSVRGLEDNPFNKIYEIKEQINRNNTKYKNNFIILKFNNILEYNDWTDIEYLNNNIRYAIGSINALKKYIESAPEDLKNIIKEYQILTHVINIKIDEEIKDLTKIANTLLKNNQTLNIIKEIEVTREGLSLIKSCMDNFKKENDPDDNEIYELIQIYKKVEYSIVKIVNLDFINKQFDLAIEYNNIIFKKARSMGYTISEADLFLETYEKKNKIKYKKIIKSKYDSMYLFKDNSLLFKNKEGGYTEVSDNQHFKQIQKEIKIDIVRHELRKNPSLLKSMIDVVKRTDTNHEQIFKIIETYQENQTILKNYNFNFVESLSEITGNCNYNELEKIDDGIQKLLRQHKVKQFAYSIASKKYHRLYNEETITLMEHIYDLELDSEIIQNEIGKKMASYKNSVEFNEVLYKFYKYFTDVARDKRVEDFKSMNIEVIREDDKIIIVKIDNFNQSKQFGSASWCITREEKYFEKYTKNNKKQYFIFNYEKKLTDISSLIGITLDNGQLDIAHYKDDTRIKNNDEYLQECIKIINTQKTEDDTKKLKKKA